MTNKGTYGHPKLKKISNPKNIKKTEEQESKCVLCKPHETVKWNSDYHGIWNFDFLALEILVELMHNCIGCVYCTK